MSHVLGFDLHLGDLLFQDLGGGAMSEAIAAVTRGYQGARITHVAMVVSFRRGGAVIEALYPSVRYEPLMRFLQRATDDHERPAALVGRLLPEHRGLIPRALAEADRLVGRPYDVVFGHTEDAYYCSELIVDTFRAANGGHALFHEHPMSFSDPVTGAVDPYWVAHFAALGLPVPEGEIGSNPARLSMEPVLAIEHQYGSLHGLPMRRRPTGP
jgi:Permuted papain-like amidase enzyme, YaeF/YiiX, C92 family